MTQRFIAHLDMDAFYASVELLRYPELRGRPVVIGGRRRTAQDAAAGIAFPTLRDYTGRGVITTATYEARAFGVNSGMGLMKAAKLAPDRVRNQRSGADQQQRLSAHDAKPLLRKRRPVDPGRRSLSVSSALD